MRRCLFLTAIASLALGACSADDADRVGIVDLSLTGRAPSGAIYTLRDATLTIAPAGLVFRTEDDPARTAISAHLDAGFYTLDLGDGWRLERTGGGPPETVFAVLTSPDPLPFDVVAGERTSVVIGFRAAGERVPLGKGDADITIAVDDHEPGADVDAGVPDARPAPTPDAQPAPTPDAAGPTPHVAIVSGPVGPISSRSPIFEFAAFDAVSTTCRLTADAAFLPCISPFTATALLDRDYQFEVRATGASGEVATASRAFTVDTVRPTVTITSSPLVPGSDYPSTTDTTPTFEFISSEPATLKCRIDTGSAQPCSSPFTTTPLYRSTFLTHIVEFSATDAAGNTGFYDAIFYVLAN